MWCCSKLFEVVASSCSVSSQVSHVCVTFPTEETCSGLVLREDHLRVITRPWPIGWVFVVEEWVESSVDTHFSASSCCSMCSNTGGSTTSGRCIISWSISCSNSLWISSYCDAACEMVHLTLCACLFLDNRCRVVSRWKDS